MNKRDFKRHIAYEVIVILGVLALLLLVCRLWPILLLVILGIFIAALRLLFLSAKKVEIIEPLSLPQAEYREPTEKDMQSMAFGFIQRRITELALSEFPDARWVWESANAKALILENQDVYILLNRAGGYRRALVQIQNLQVLGLKFQTEPDSAPVQPEEDDEEDEQDVPVNFEYIAFEWADAHAVALNERCNEWIAQGHTALLIGADELPDPQSWPDICRELNRNGIENCECRSDGIQINLTQ